MPRLPSIFRRNVSLFFALLALSCLTLTPADAAEPHPDLTVNTTIVEAQEVLQEVIEEEGLIPSPPTHISDMMVRTAPTLGKTKLVYGEAVVIPFCSAKVGWQLVEEDPHQLTLCPFAVALYTLPGSPGTVHISYRSPGNRSPALRTADALLRKIADTTLQRLKHQE